MTNYVIFDLEATCGEGVETSEIIEIGAVKLNEKLKVIDSYQAFIRPELHPMITYFCEELTSITQANVDSANTFDKVFPDFINWCESIVPFSQYTDDFWLCSWGFYDKKMLIQECDRHKIPHNNFKNHISIKHQHGELLYAQEKAILEAAGRTPNSRLKQLKRGVGMDGALKMLNIELEGTHHRGIDDARNISKIFVKIFDDLKFD